jgi:hypothetical protein
MDEKQWLLARKLAARSICAEEEGGGMICPDCGREHTNARGKCPFCGKRRALARRQKERPAKVLGSVFECTKCGGEVTFVSVKKNNQMLDVPVHLSSGTLRCPDAG